MVKNEDINIVLVGEDTIYVTHGSTYYELGAVAAHIPSNTMLEVTVIGDANPNQIGTQEVIYRAEFEEGYNEKKRTIVVYERIPPRIMFKPGYDSENPWPYATSISETDVRSFISAVDAKGQDITADVSMNYYDPVNHNEVTLDFLDVDTINDQIRVLYRVLDDAGNSATPLECIIKIAPTSKPIITLEGKTNMEMDVYDTYIEPGYSAVDALGRDISHLVIPTVDGQNLSLVQDKLTDKPGIKVIKYEATDEWDGTSFVERTLYVSSEKNPTIVLAVDNVEVDRGYYIDKNYFAQLVSVVDYVDGHKLVNQVEIDMSTLDTSEHGVYDVKFNVTNSIGLDAPEKVMKVYVINQTEAKHLLYPEQTDREIDYDEDYTKERLLKGVVFRDYKNTVISNDDIEVDMQDINLKGPGTYNLYYRALDFTGLKTRWIEAVIVKKNTAKPVIINDVPTEIIGVNTPYTTAIALTGVHGLTYQGVDISSYLSADLDNLDVSTVGTYSVTYSLENPINLVSADTVQRTIEVTDPSGLALYNSQEVVMVPLNAVITDEEKREGVKLIDGDGAELPADNLVVEDNIDTSVAGEYEIVYSYSMGDYSLNPVTRQVVVTEGMSESNFVSYSVGENQDEVAVYRSENGEDYIKVD